ncbi:MAG: hypothetical protein PVG70_14640 [Desulfobacterales bacterium]|jgi:hypothetical protein
MKNQRIVGIGCFAGPETLSRVAKKWIGTYTLGQFQSIRVGNDKGLTQSLGTQLLNAIITGRPKKIRKQTSKQLDGLQDKKITGFFLEMKDHRLNLSVFAKGASSRRERYTATLDAVTRIRQKRLN